MKLWPEFCDAHEGFWGCGFGVVVLEFWPKCMNIMELCTGYDVTVCTWHFGNQMESKLCLCVVEICVN